MLLYHAIITEGFSSEILLSLCMKNHVVDANDDKSFAVVQGVKVDSEGTVTAHADSRKQGEKVIVTKYKIQ